jgi:hypothetical protein
MDGSRARFDQAFHQFESIEDSTKSSFGIRDNWQHPIDRVLGVSMCNLVGPHQWVVNGSHHTWHTVGGIKTLVRITSDRPGLRLPQPANRLGKWLSGQLSPFPPPDFLSTHRGPGRISQGEAGAKTSLRPHEQANTLPERSPGGAQRLRFRRYG